MTDRISLLIKAKNLSAAQFADEIGVQRSSISHLMSGRNKPSLDLIQKTLQRFPEVSTEWLLFGKGEMVRELNLFNSPSRSGMAEKEEKPDFVNGELLQTGDREPSLFSDASQGVDTNIHVPDRKDARADLNQTRERMATPGPGEEENVKRIEVIKESGNDSANIINRAVSKKGSAINQVIVFYDDLTFIAYSPGN